jgi:hypothetical protein
MYVKVVVVVWVSSTKMSRNMLEETDELEATMFVAISLIAELRINIPNATNGVLAKVCMKV